MQSKKKRVSFFIKQKVYPHLVNRSSLNDMVRFEKPHKFAAPKVMFDRHSCIIHFQTGQLRQLQHDYQVN